MKLSVFSNSMAIPVKPAKTVVISMMRRFRSERLVVRLGMVIEKGRLIRVNTDAKIPALA